MKMGWNTFWGQRGGFCSFLKLGWSVHEVDSCEAKKQGAEKILYVSTTGAFELKQIEFMEVTTRRDTRFSQGTVREERTASYCAGGLARGLRSDRQSSKN